MPTCYCDSRSGCTFFWASGRESLASQIRSVRNPNVNRSNIGTDRKDEAPISNGGGPSGARPSGSRRSCRLCRLARLANATFERTGRRRRAPRGRSSTAISFQNSSASDALPPVFSTRLPSSSVSSPVVHDLLMPPPPGRSPVPWTGALPALLVIGPLAPSSARAGSSHHVVSLSNRADLAALSELRIFIVRGRGRRRARPFADAHTWGRPNRPSAGEAVMSRHLGTFPKTVLGSCWRMGRTPAFCNARRQGLSRRGLNSGKFGTGVGERPLRHNHQFSRALRTDGGL